MSVDDVQRAPDSARPTAEQRHATRRERGRRDWPPPDSTGGRVLQVLRWVAVLGWLVVAGYFWTEDGVPFGRSDLLLWLIIGLLACCVGRRPVWVLYLVVDFGPFAAVLVVYDYLRGWADTVGLPTWWHPQIDLDRALFLGHQPTVWLQAHLKDAEVRWYDVLAAACYYSFFFLPYLTAAVMWLRSRADFYRWSLRFVGLSLLGFTLFVLIPAAPPWAAARCTAADVAGRPHNPICMYYPSRPVPGNLLGPFGTGRPGAAAFVERTVNRGFGELHLGVATTLLSEGRIGADAVAAVPSLHLGGTVLFVLFVWRRLNRWWRPVLVAYPLLMTFSLVYTGEHYVVDCIAGALIAWLVHAVATRLERRVPAEQRTNGPDALDTLAAQPEPMLET